MIYHDENVNSRDTKFCVAWVYTYVLRSKKDGMFYTGVTRDLQKRLQEHNNGKVQSTQKRCPFDLIYYEACLNERDAFAREKYLKTGMGKRYLKNRIKHYLENL